LVVSQNAWSCQRSVRFDEYICLRTYHDGYKELDPVMLFDIAEDAHEQCDLAASRPELVNKAMGMLETWHHDKALSSRVDVDPMMTVLREGGPFHTRGRLGAYVERLRATGRAHHAERLILRHPTEA
jgi:hypothetical protein